MNIAKSFKVACATWEVTQQQLSRKIGKSEPTVSSWCNGKAKPSIETIGLICEEFKTPVSTFIKWGE